MAKHSGVSRTAFLAAVGTAGAATALPAAAAKPVKAPAKASGGRPEAFTFFTVPERAFVEGAVERLIPKDALGPGAREAGVAYFIDQQLDGQFGYAAKMYTQGPWPPGLPTQGYQLPLAPRDVYRLGIAATNAYCERTYHKSFDRLDAAHQDEVLTALDGAKLAFDEVPAKVFFEMLYENTLEGYFSDPMYGGNRDKVSWKLIGFPGASAAYLGLVEKHNVPYKVAPMSIADMQGEEAAMMPDGAKTIADRVAMHVMLGRKALGLE